MPDKIVEIPGVGVVAFPATMADDAIAAEATKLTAAKTPSGPASPAVAGSTSNLDHLLGFLEESTRSLNPKAINEGIQQAFWHPVDTAKGMYEGQMREFDKAGAAFAEGDPVTAAAKALYGLIPLLGPRMSEAGDLLQAGEYGRGLGATADVGLQVAAPKIAKAGAGKVERAMRARADKLRTSSATDIRQALSPTRHRTKVKTERLVPKIQERGLTGDLNDLRTLSKAKLDEVGPQIDAVLKANKGERVSLKPVRSALAKEKAKTFNEASVRVGAKPVIDARTGKPVTEPAIHNPRKFQQIQGLEDLLAKYGDDLSVEQAVSIRKAWDDVVKQAGGFDEKAGKGAFGVGLADVSEAAVKSKAVTALRNEIVNKAVPSVKSLNREYGFWADLHDVTSASKFRKVGQRTTGLLGKTVENTGRLLGGGAGYATGGLYGAGTGALVGGAIAKRLTNLFASPRWKLSASKFKIDLANALASRNPQRIGDAIAQLERSQPAVQAAGRAAEVRPFPKAAEAEEAPAR